MTIPLALFTAALIVAASSIRELSALTIVRIGGQNLPASDRAGAEGIDFVQLTWKEATGGNFGSTSLIDFNDSAIAPIFASPDVNLTLTMHLRSSIQSEAIRLSRLITSVFVFIGSQHVTDTSARKPANH